MPMMPTHASEAPASRTYQSGISGTARRVPRVKTKCRRTNAWNGRWRFSRPTKSRAREPSDAPGSRTTGGWSGRRIRLA